jgi:hypothetical protein
MHPDVPSVPDGTACNAVADVITQSALFCLPCPVFGILRSSSHSCDAIIIEFHGLPPEVKETSTLLPRLTASLAFHSSLLVLLLRFM